MISRRNFFSIAALMLVIFFMFQFTNVALELWNHYEENAYAVDLASLPGENGAYTLNTSGEDTLWGNVRPTVTFIGERDSAMGQVVSNWAAYTKRRLSVQPALQGYVLEDTIPEFLVLDAASMDWDENACQLLLEWAEKGCDLVFGSLPAPFIIREIPGLQELLGIYEIRADRAAVEGLHLYAGFFLGGEVIYQGADAQENELRQDLDLDIPWYIPDIGTKVYMKGIPAGDVKAEDHPAIIWRRSLNGSFVFAINGRYMEDATGLGILSAIVSQSGVLDIYPVINAQNLVVANYPGLAMENEDVLSQYYSASMQGIFRDILWPDITAIYHQGKLGFSCMMAPQFDYGDSNLPDSESFVYYMKLLNELRAEAGISAFSVSETPMAEKLLEDLRFMEHENLGYRFTSLYAGEAGKDIPADALQAIPTLRTVVFPYDGGSELVGYQNESVTWQMAVADGFGHTYRSDFRVRSVETALAYTSILADVARAVYPESAEVTWNSISQRFSSDVPQFWREFESFDGTSVSECDERVRRFLSLDYTYKYDGETVSLRHSGDGTAWFILRVNNRRVRSVEGGTVRRIEEGVYLIGAKEKDVTITLLGIRANVRDGYRIAPEHGDAI